MSRHKWMKREEEPAQDLHTPASEHDGTDSQPRSTPRGFAVRSDLRAGQSETTEAILEKVRQWFENCTGC